MKSILALLGLVSAGKMQQKGDPPVNFFDFDNSKMLWKGDWEYYRSIHGNDADDNNCRLAESDNFLGA